MNELEYNEKAEKLLEKVPTKYRNGCKQLAWDLGHAYGYHEVYNYLQDIVDRIFK
jgi:hypothetical protein